MFENQNQGFALDWDSAIEKDSPNFVLLKEGDYDFEITNFERQRHNGSGKLPPCPKAVVTLRVEGIDENGNPGVSMFNHNLFLHSSCEGLLSAFFTGIGRKKKGERLNMDWSNLIGQRGYAHIGIREWTNDKGETRRSNEVRRFYSPEDAALMKAKAGIQSFHVSGQNSPAVPQWTKVDDELPFDMAAGKPQAQPQPQYKQMSFTPGNF